MSIGDGSAYSYPCAVWHYLLPIFPKKSKIRTKRLAPQEVPTVSNEHKIYTAQLCVLNIDVTSARCARLCCQRRTHTEVRYWFYSILEQRSLMMRSNLQGSPLRLSNPLWRENNKYLSASASGCDGDPVPKKWASESWTWCWLDIVNCEHEQRPNFKVANWNVFLPSGEQIRNANKRFRLTLSEVMSPIIPKYGCHIAAELKNANRHGAWLMTMRNQSIGLWASALMPCRNPFLAARVRLDHKILQAHLRITLKGHAHRNNIVSYPLRLSKSTSLRSPDSGLPTHIIQHCYRVCSGLGHSFARKASTTY